jgi:hypothetical protein
VQVGRALERHRRAIDTTVVRAAVVFIGNVILGTITNRLGLSTEDHQGNNEKSEEKLELRHG